MRSDEWIAIAKDRSKWRQLTRSIPKPPDAWRLEDTSREMITIALRKRTLSPVRLVLKVTFFVLLFATVVYLCIFGSIN